LRYDQRAVRFACHGSWLYGVLCIPERSGPRGVLIVVGGPQYRAGSHRQFTLLSRHLAAHGIAAMRFDYRGMGDSEGEHPTFEHAGDDIRCAIDHMLSELPALREVILWGLCDAASAVLFYAHQDARVRGLVLLNPWIRTEAGTARTYLKHYYARRLLQRDLWRKMFSGRFGWRAALGSMLGTMAKAMTAGRRRPPPSPTAALPQAASLPDRMLAGLARFNGKVLLILSGNDLDAREFIDVTGASPAWQQRLRGAGVQQRHLVDANHTFSRSDWRNQVAAWTTDWIASW
jgi:exosortase A-associated hydrolase 1